jgi:hypothetical protein
VASLSEIVTVPALTRLVSFCVVLENAEYTPTAAKEGWNP